MTNLLILLIAGLFSSSYAQAQKVEPIVPEGWNKVEAAKFFTFCLPMGMRLTSEARCRECAWGSTYSNDQIKLYAEYSSWNEEYAPHYLAKQADYIKEMGTIDGNNAKFQSWKLEQPIDGYVFTTEVRIYNPDTAKLIARMSAACKERSDLGTAKEIFKTIRFQ